MCTGRNPGGIARCPSVSAGGGRRLLAFSASNRRPPEFRGGSRGCRGRLASADGRRKWSAAAELVGVALHESWSERSETVGGPSDWIRTSCRCVSETFGNGWR